jgi:hypothetical protein
VHKIMYFFGFFTIAMFTDESLKAFIKHLFQKNIPHDIPHIDLLCDWAVHLIALPSVESVPPEHVSPERESYLKFVRENNKKVQDWCDEGYHEFILQIKVCIPAY